jgi:hypothetical protein
MWSTCVCVCVSVSVHVGVQLDKLLYLVYYHVVTMVFPFCQMVHVLFDTAGSRSVMRPFQTPHLRKLYKDTIS